MESTLEAKRKWDSYFDDVSPRQWRFLGFYQTCSLRPEFSRSFAKEASDLKKSLDLLSINGSATAKDFALKLLDNFKNHRKKYGEVDQFWITIEEEEVVRTKVSAQKLSLELSKISSIKKVYDCATTFTEEVFETATGNLRDERKRKLPWQKQSEKKIKASNFNNFDRENSNECISEEERTHDTSAPSIPSTSPDEPVQTNNILPLFNWELNSVIPCWLIKAAQAHLSLRSSTDQSEAMTKVLYWKIVDMSDPTVISEFSSEEFEALNTMFASMLKRGDPKDDLALLEPSAERCLQMLGKLDLHQLKSVGNLVKVEGIRGAVREVKKLVTRVKEKKDDHGFFEDEEVDEALTPLGDLQEEDILQDDVGYIFELLRYACEWISKSIPERHNSERDMDMFVKVHVFSCLDGVVDHHFGEIVSRASRDRRAHSSEASNKVEGYHIDWLFPRHDLASGSWGREFSLCERAGSKVENNTKILSDTLKAQKTLRDMHKILVKDIAASGNGAVSKSVLNAFTKLLMPGFISSHFLMRVILVIYAGGGYYASVQLAEFKMPVTYDQLGSVLEIARIMLWVKRILRTTVSGYKALKARAEKEKFALGRTKIVDGPPEAHTPKKRSAKHLTKESAAKLDTLTDSDNNPFL